MTATPRRSELLEATLQHQHSHSVVLRRPPLLHRRPPVASAQPLHLLLPLHLDPRHHHQLLLPRPRQPSILQLLPLHLAVLLRRRRHHRHLLVERHSHLAPPTPPPRLRRRSPLDLEQRLQLHHRPLLSQDRKTPAPYRRHLDSVRRPPLLSNLPRAALAHRPLVDSEHRRPLRLVDLGRHPPSLVTRLLEELRRPRPALVDSALVPVEAPIRAASNAAESFGHEGLPAKATYLL